MTKKNKALQAKQIAQSKKIRDYHESLQQFVAEFLFRIYFDGVKPTKKDDLTYFHAHGVELLLQIDMRDCYKPTMNGLL